VARSRSPSERGTFGQLFDSERRQLCVTLELPWRNNEHDRSCIPAGTYTLRRRFSPKHQGEVFEVEGVPDRADIELHVGNFVDDSLGCILLGSTFTTFDSGQHGISGSRVAFERFMAAMQGVDVATITIIDPPATP
jgi:hypothetical protein